MDYTVGVGTHRMAGRRGHRTPHYPIRGRRGHPWGDGRHRQRDRGAPRGDETRLRTITGDERWVATRAAPLFDGNGETTGSIINVRDVNTEHLVRARLAESEERFRLAMVSAPIGMAVIGLDRHFLEVNLVLCHMVGRDEQWMLQHRVPDILDPADDPLDVHMR